MRLQCREILVMLKWESRISKTRLAITIASLMRAHYVDVDSPIIDVGSWSRSLILSSRAPVVILATVPVMIFVITEGRA